MGGIILLVIAVLLIYVFAKFLAVALFWACVVFAFVALLSLLASG